MFLADQLMVLLALAVTGEPVRIVASKHIQALKNLDIFQIATLDFFIGGFVVYTLALIPFGFFTRSITLILVITSFIFTLGYRIKRLYLSRKNNDAWLEKISLFFRLKVEICLGFFLVTIFVVIMWIHTEATVGILFGNVHDASLFSMLATVISKNGMIPGTLSPFESSGIIYPQGYSVLLTFASYLLNCGPEELILTLVSLFQGLTILSAYYLGKVFSGKMSTGVIFSLG
jgi:hypothetical protein